MQTILLETIAEVVSKSSFCPFQLTVPKTIFELTRGLIYSVVDELVWRRTTLREVTETLLPRFSFEKHTLGENVYWYVYEVQRQKLNPEFILPLNDTYKVLTVGKRFIHLQTISCNTMHVCSLRLCEYTNPILQLF